MRTRFPIILTVLLSLVVVLALPACRLMTGPETGVVLSPVGGHEDDDSTGIHPPPPPLGFSLGVSCDTTVTAGGAMALQLFAQNHEAEVDTVNYRFTGPEGWGGLPATGSLTVLGGASATVDVPVTVPAGTAPGSYLFHYELEKTNGTVLQSGVVPTLVISN